MSERAELGALDAEVAAIANAGKQVVLAIRFQSGGGIGPDTGPAWRVRSFTSSGGVTRLKVAGGSAREPNAQPYPGGSCGVDLPSPFLAGDTVTASSRWNAQDSIITHVLHSSGTTATITVSPRLGLHTPSRLLVPTCRDYSVVGNESNGGFEGLSTDFLPFWLIQAMDTDPNHPGALCDSSTGVFMPDYWNRTFQRYWLSFVDSVAAHFDRPARSFPLSDPLRFTDYTPARVDYVRVAMGISDEGMAYLPHSSLGPQYQTWASLPGLPQEACPSAGSANWSTNWLAWQECMLAQYRAAFTFIGRSSPVVVFPLNIGQKSSRIAGITNSDSCDLGGSTGPCSIITLLDPKPSPPDKAPSNGAPVGSGSYAHIQATAVGSANVTAQDADNHGGETGGLTIYGVREDRSSTTVTVAPQLPYTDYLSLTWPNVSLATDPSSGRQYWSSVALEVAQWAEAHGFGVGQNGLSSGWALNWHAYSYLQGSRTGDKSSNYYPEVPSSLDAQMMLQLATWAAESGHSPAISELQTVSSSSERCTDHVSSPGEVNVCVPYANLSPAYPLCARWNVQWTAWLAQSNWRFNPENSGLPGYFPTTLEVYDSDLDDQTATDNVSNPANGVQGVQTTFRKWAESRSQPLTPPLESAWNKVCP